MTIVSYAQNFEDIMLLRAFADVPDGFYVDVGAGDPVEGSVTHLFSEKGWTGINLEPLESVHRRLAELRPRDINIRAAAWDAVGTREFYVVQAGELDESGLSTLDASTAESLADRGHTFRRTTVDTVRLADVLERHARGVIHFLKVDVEGAEAQVLAGCDFDKHRPWIVLVEATRPNAPDPNHHEWEPGLISSGYRFAYFDGLNRFYIASEHFEDLKKHFDRPPNHFDRFVRASEVRAENALEEANRHLARLAADYDSSRQALAETERRIDALVRKKAAWKAKHAKKKSALQRLRRERKARNARRLTSRLRRLVGKAD